MANGKSEHIETRHIDEDDDLGIYTVPEFGSDGDGHSSWNRIGTGVQNENGSITLKFDCWPTNVRSIELRPLVDSSP